MRSQLVYEAGLKIENRFLLATTAMQATRKLHISSTRTEDTVNKVLAEVANGVRVHGKLPEVAPPPVIDELLITPAA
ncbi:MAG TPA: DNA-directed RNA polymerase subunit omega [Terracidiphilus sp.]|nr:DNA-directed RNA polymerase subunit omega [Terracidiphilus sp.]